MIYTKDRIQRIEQALFSAILLYLLLEQQQQELQVQRRELAEQRALIRQLQESQKTETSQPDKDLVVKAVE